MSISITSPVTGDTVFGTIDIVGASAETITSTPASTPSVLADQPFTQSVDTTTLPNGSQSLSVNNGVASASVSVNVNNIVTVAAPAAGFSANSPLAVSGTTNQTGDVLVKQGATLLATLPIVAGAFSGSVAVPTGAATLTFSVGTAPAVSVSGTILVPTSADGSTIPPNTSLVDAAGANWTVVSGVVKKNGVNAGFTAQVLTLLWYSGSIWQENVNHLWWPWSGTAWTGSGVADPRAPAATLAISRPVAAQMTGSFCTVSGTTNQSSVVIKDGATVLATVTPVAGAFSTQVKLNSTVGSHTLNVSAGTATPVAVAVTVGNPLPAKTFYGMNGHLAWGGSSVWNTTYTKAMQLADLQDLGCTMYRADVAESTMAGVIKAQLVPGGTFYNQGIGFLVCLNAYSMGWRPTMNEADSYALGYSRAVSIGNTLNGYADYFEAGNELDQYIRSTTTPGNGASNNNWDQAGFVSCRGMTRGMFEGLLSVNSDFQVGLNIGIPMATAFVKMLWDGVEPNGTTGKPVLRGKYLNWHWYESSGNIETAGGSLNIPQFIKDNFGNTPWIFSEWGWKGASSPNPALYTGNTMAQYRNAVNFKDKYNLIGIYQYAMIDASYGLIQADGVTKNPAYTTVKNFIAANPV